MHPDVVTLSFPVTSSLDSYSDKKLRCAAFCSLFTYTGSSASCSPSWPLKGFLTLSWQFSLELFLTDVLHPQSVIRCSHNSLQWLHAPLSGIGRELWLVQMLDDSFWRPYLVGVQHLPTAVCSWHTPSGMLRRVTSVLCNRAEWQHLGMCV